MSQVVVAGATGGIGQYLVPFLTERGYRISTIVRDTEKSKRIFPTVANHIDWSDGASIYDVLFDSDAIINLSGASIATRRWTKAYKEEIYRSRIETTRILVQKLNEINTPKTYINASAIGFYPTLGDKLIDETIGEGGSFISSLCVDWEKEALSLKNIHRLVIGRFGVVLKPNDTLMEKMLASYKFGFGVVMGSGTQWFSWIHIRDLLNALLFSVENPKVQGTFNFTSPNPIMFSEVIQNIGKILNRPFVLNIPEYLIKLIFGEQSQVILGSQRVIPKRLLELGFTFEFENIEEALEDIIG
jgi:uncharacterized protein (TIGR01777 family)